MTNTYTNNSFKTWEFGTVNIRSGKEKDEGAKIYAIAKQAAQLKLSICCLQEVKYRNTGSKLIELDSGEKYEFHWCGMKKRREAGVGVLIKCDEDILISDPDVKDHRIIALNLKIYGFNVRLVNVYAPTETGGSLPQKDAFYRSMKKACVKTEKHQKLIIVGDFNATTSVALQKCNYDGLQIVPDEICNDNGTRLKNFCRSTKLCISSSFFDYNLENRFTWCSPDGNTRKKLDYVLVENFVQQYVTECKSQPQIDFDSDHVVLITKMSTPKTRKARWKKKTQQKVKKKNIAMLREKAIQKQFEDKLIDVLDNKRLTQATTEETSNTIIKTVNEVATAILPDLKRNGGDETWKCDEELNLLLNDRMESNLGSDRHKELTKRIKSRVKHLRNLRLKREAEEINNFANRRKIEEMFCKIKSDDSAFKDIKSNSKCDPTKLKEYFKKHFCQDMDETSPIETINSDLVKLLQENSNEPMNTRAPDANEILQVLRSLKKGKAATDLPVEYIKVAINNKKFLDETVELYQTIWNTHAIPKSWSHSKLVAIWKGASKGNKDDPAAYRALQIGSSLSKILVVIIIKRIQSWYENQITDQQQGFRKGRGTTDGIYLAKRIHQITDHLKQPVYALFIDLTAAFDHVPRSALFQSMKKRLSDTHSKKLINLLEVLYSHTTTALVEAPEHTIDVQTGVRQGGPESPMLFNLYVDLVMRIFLITCAKSKIKFLKFKYRIPECASQNKREQVGYQQIDWIGYADDLILTFESIKDLKCALKILDETFQKFSLSINSKKTKTMILNHQFTGEAYPETVCQLNGNNIDNVKTFIYLGSCIKYDEPNTGNTEIELRIDYAENSLYQYSKKFFNQKISIKTRVQIMNSMVRSRLVYGCQTWSMTKLVLQKIKAAYSGFLRKMIKGGFRRKEDSWGFVLTNENIRQQCSTEDIEVFIRRQQRNYLAHIIRQEDASIVKRLTYNDDKRRPGRYITMERMVLAHDQTGREEFARRAMNREF